MNKLSSSDSLLPPDEVTDLAGYENDFVLWIDQQVELLRARKFDQLDLDNLIDEMDAMGGSQRRELGSRLEVLIMQMLKCLFQPEKKSRSWLGTISAQRSELQSLFEQSPSLRGAAAPRIQRAYGSAAHRASVETGLPESTFPSENPYSIEQLLDPRFFP